MLLTKHLSERATTPFAWKGNHCGTLAADWVLLKTGVDPMADIRNLESALQVLRYMKRMGGAVATGDALLGNRVPPLFAQRGDVCLVPSGGRIGKARGYTFGVCNGSLVAVPGADGVVFVPITEVVATWRV